jgi:hypothetical protein
MKAMKVMRRVAHVAGLALWAGAAMAQAPANAPATIAGQPCGPPALHCPDTECLGVMVINPGPAVEPKTRRTFFLDCPIGYKKGDKVVFLLALHGGGSYANWQRNYAPFMDQKDKYKLVIATPSSPTRVWQPEDDQYLQNIVDLVVGTIGKENVTAFWLAGHSQGGATSSRLICTDYFKDKVDVRISLSGGRTGSPPRAPTAGAPATVSGAPNIGGGGGPPGAPAAAPTCDFSSIFTQGENEAISQGGLPEKNLWAEKYGCGPRVKRANVVDTKQGYVWDSTRQNPGSDMWGRYPKPGEAEVYQYPNCKDGRVVADVLRMKKGHTEGLEPNVIEEIVKLASSAKGGKIQKGSWNPPPPPAPPAGLGGPRPGAAPGAAPAAGARPPT